MHPLGGLGHLAKELGDFRRAAALYQESLRLRREVGDQFALAQSLEDLARLAGTQQQWERAATLLGAAEAVCTGLGATLPVANAAEYASTVSGACSALGEKAFAAAWAEGRAMSLDDAVAFALAAEG